MGATLCIGASAALRAEAAPITFAQMSESRANVSANVFAFNNNGPGLGATLGTSAGGILGAAIPINFSYESGAGTLASDLTGIQNATVSMTCSTFSPAATAFGGTFAQEAITGATGVFETLEITRVTPAGEGGGTRTNLLTISFTGYLSGAVGTGTPTLTADSGLKDKVVYSSDFLSFAQTSQEDFTMAFSSWNPLVTPPSGLGIGSDGYFNSATAAAVGTFDLEGSVSAAPEPGVFQGVLVGTGLVVMAWWRRRRGESELD